MDIKVGTVFDTEYESSCVAVSEPNADGEFIAKDSDGVECWFNVSMVTVIWKS